MGILSLFKIKIYQSGHEKEGYVIILVREIGKVVEL